MTCNSNISPWNDPLQQHFPGSKLKHIAGAQNTQRHKRQTNTSWFRLFEYVLHRLKPVGAVTHSVFAVSSSAGGAPTLCMEENLKAVKVSELHAGYCNQQQRLPVCAALMFTDACPNWTPRLSHISVRTRAATNIRSMLGSSSRDGFIFLYEAARTFKPLTSLLLYFHFILLFSDINTFTSFFSCFLFLMSALL